MKISNKKLDDMSSFFGYNGLPERWKIIDKYFNIRSGDIVIDGGAYHGDMAYYFSQKVGKKGRVYSFEPNPLNVVDMYRTIIELELDNVYLYSMAISDEKNVVNLYLDTDYGNTGSLIPTFKKVYGKEVFKMLVLSDSLDDIVRLHNIPKIDFVWLNIEASEVNALKGMSNILSNYHPDICISPHKYFDNTDTSDECKDILSNFNYDVSTPIPNRKWIVGKFTG